MYSALCYGDVVPYFKLTSLALNNNQTIVPSASSATLKDIGKLITRAHKNHNV